MPDFESLQRAGHWIGRCLSGGKRRGDNNRGRACEQIAARQARRHGASYRACWQQPAARLRCRMRTALTLALGIAIGSAATAALQPSSLLADADTRTAVARVKEGIVSGHRTRNRAALDALYAENYTALDARGGLRTKADLLGALPNDAEMLEGRYTIGQVRRWGNIAVASGHGRMVYRNTDGSSRVSEYDSVNVFEERDGRWWYVAAFLP